MNFLRKLISFIVIVGAGLVLVGICMSSTMKPVWDAFAAAFSPFSFDKLVTALATFITFTGNCLVLIVVGFIGLTLPKAA